MAATPGLSFAGSMSCEAGGSEVWKPSASLPNASFSLASCMSVDWLSDETLG